MSSLLRRIQRAAKKSQPYNGRGTRLGVPTNTKAKDYLARIKREERNAKDK